MEGCVLGELPVAPMAVTPKVSPTLPPPGVRRHIAPAALSALVQQLAIEHLAAHGGKIIERELHEQVLRRDDAPIREIDAAHGKLDPKYRRGRGER